MSIPSNISYDDFAALAPKFKEHFDNKRISAAVVLIDKFINTVANNNTGRLSKDAQEQKCYEILTEFFDVLGKVDRQWVLRKLRDQRYEGSRIRISVDGLTVGALEELIEESGGKFKNFDSVIYELISVYRDQQKEKK